MRIFNKQKITKFEFIGLILLILFSILLFGFLLEDKVNAQTDINWSIQADSVANGAGGSGVPNNIRDDDESTSYGASCGVGPYDQCEWNYWATVTFSQPTTINKAEICHMGGISGGGGLSWYVDLYYDGAWHNVMSGGDTGGSITTNSNSAGWDNVTAIKVRAGGSAGGAVPQPSLSVHRTYELRAWGPPPPSYVDCGLRFYNGTAAITIACEPSGTLTSPLRIRKGATTYGIVLVDTTDANASPIRIQTSSGLKALSKY